MKLGMLMTAEVQQEFEEMAQDFRNLADLYKEAWNAGILPWGLFIIGLYVVTWVILVKTGLVDTRLKKAKKHGRMVTAYYNDNVPEEVFQGIDVEPGEIRCFHYRYTHPLTGKELQYELDLSEKGTAPPAELPMYYTPGGRFFTEYDTSKANASSPFWMAVGIIVPGLIAAILMCITGYNPY